MNCMNCNLMIPDSYDAKIAKMEHLAKKLFGRMVYYLSYKPECPKVAYFCYFRIIAIKYP